MILTTEDFLLMRCAAPWLLLVLLVVLGWQKQAHLMKNSRNPDTSSMLGIIRQSMVYLSPVLITL